MECNSQLLCSIAFGKPEKFKTGKRIKIQFCLITKENHRDSLCCSLNNRARALGNDYGSGLKGF